MKCLLDIDGVLADFHTHWYTVQPRFTRPDPWPEGVWSFSDVHECTWTESCQGLDLNFWTSMPWMLDGKEILTLLESHFGQENICLLTSNDVDDAATAAMGKVLWIEKELPSYKNRYFLGAAKGFLAHEGVILIDDKNENVDNFWNAGGGAFLLPRPWNRRYFNADQSVEQLRRYLETTIVI